MSSHSSYSPVSVVIPSWNGWRLLEENLPSVLAAVNEYETQTGQPIEVLVVDDGGSDETPSSLPVAFPRVRLIRRPKNGGFSAACNTGIFECRHPVLALLNNDVRVDRSYFLHLVPHFEDPEVFGVTARVFEWDEPVFATGGKVGRFRRGFWSAYFNYDVESTAENWIVQRKLLSFYAVGGFAAFSTSKLRDLQGFCSVLSPFHWEDIDVSYRAWKRGWWIRYEPRSLAFHRDSATIDSHYKSSVVEQVALRNRILFHWINLHSPAWLLAHILMLVMLCLTRVLVLDFGFYRSLTGALRRLGEVRRLRRIEKRANRRTDREVAELLQDFYASVPARIYYNRAEVISDHLGLEDALTALKIQEPHQGSAEQDFEN